MLWACFRFPEIALDALCIDADAQNRTTPFAVVDGPQQRRHIVLANIAARRVGVRGGQLLAAAQALCPRLVAVARDEAAERQALESIATWAYRFSADVSIAAPDTVFLEIGASLTLFGGIAALERRLRLEIAVFGFQHALTIATTATGARVLASHANGIAIPGTAQLVNALGAVPLIASGFDDKTIAALHGMGFRALRDLFRLPRAELARRIGQHPLDHLDRMRGMAGETLLRYRPPDRFERRLEFAFGIESQTALAFPLLRLIREFAAFLVARDGGVQHFVLVLGHERGATTRIDVGLLAPQRDAASLAELARARLDRIELPAPVHALSLCADDLPPLSPLHRDLFDVGRREALDWPALAERLRARLGDAALRGLRCAADHRPGRAWRFAPIAENPICASAERKPRAASSSEGVDERFSATHGARPFWLLSKPMLLRGAPTKILSGPERIESGWWDDYDKRRDYYVVTTAEGQRAWVFAAAESTSHWTLHGWFA